MDWTGRSTPAPEGVKACPTVLRSDPFCEESYRMNSKLSETVEGNKYYRPYRKLSTLTRPSQTVLLFDADIGGDKISFKGRWRKKNDDVSYRHNGATNILFTDWHVENFAEEAVYDKSINNAPIVWQPEDMGPWKPNP
jgi:prepilin-type processing-associated H-X9-DG protein